MALVGLPLYLFNRFDLLFTWPVMVFILSGVLVHMVPPHTKAQSLFNPPPFDRGSTFLMLFGYVAFGLSSFVLYLKTFTQTPCLCHWSSIIGVILMLLGLALRQWTITTMGKYFTGQVVLEQEHPVIEVGPFKHLLIRHPGYLGTLLIAIGLPFLFHSKMSFILFWVLMVPTYAFRIKVEDEELSRNIGESFDAYKKRTWRLLPYIY